MLCKKVDLKFEKKLDSKKHQIVTSSNSEVLKQYTYLIQDYIEAKSVCFILLDFCFGTEVDEFLLSLFKSGHTMFF